jgi:hypothetical protein
MSHNDKQGKQISIGNTVQFLVDGGPKRFPTMAKGHVRDLCRDGQIIVDLFQRLPNGQTRLTMPSKDATVISPVVV